MINVAKWSGCEIPPPKKSCIQGILSVSRLHGQHVPNGRERTLLFPDEALHNRALLRLV